MSSNDLLTWLLDSPTPTIRYQTLTGLLGCPPDDPAAVKACAAIATEGPVPALYGRQTAAGHWAADKSYYTPKYRSTHWSMILLDEFEAPGDDPRYQRGADFMLSAVGDRLKRRGDSGEFGFSCLFANVLHYAARAGYLDDSRTQAILRYVEADLGMGRCACAYNYGLPCGWGVARSLWAAAAIPPDQRSPALDAAIETGVRFMVTEFSLVEANYPTGEGSIHPLWFRLNFPLFYQSDILFALRTLADAGALDHPGAEEALDWLLAKRGKDGRWRGSSPFRQRTWAAVGGPEETDRWVSLQSAILLKQAGKLRGIG